MHHAQHEARHADCSHTSLCCSRLSNAQTGVRQGRQVFAPSVLRRPPLRRLSTYTRPLSSSQVARSLLRVTSSLTVSPSPNIAPIMAASWDGVGTILVPSIVPSIVSSSSSYRFFPGLPSRCHPCWSTVNMLRAVLWKEWNGYGPFCQSDVFRTHTSVTQRLDAP